MSLDTGDLSNEAYSGIIEESERFSYDLTLNYGLLASQCEDEDEYLMEAKSMTEEFLTYSNNQIEDLLFVSLPNRAEFHKTLKRIIENINRVQSIPFESRTIDD